MFKIASSWDTDTLPYRAGQQVASALATIGATGPMAEVGETGHVPLYAAFHSDQPYFGRQSVVDDLEALFQLGVRIVIVETGHEFIEIADSDSRFRNHGAIIALNKNKSTPQFHLYELQYQWKELL